MMPILRAAIVPTCLHISQNKILPLSSHIFIELEIPILGKYVEFFIQFCHSDSSYRTAILFPGHGNENYQITLSHSEQQ